MTKSKFNVKVRVDFQGEIVAESQEEAESLAWDKWGVDSDAEIGYDGVYSIEADDLGEICEECDQTPDDCECEEEEEGEAE